MISAHDLHVPSNRSKRATIDLAVRGRGMIPVMTENLCGERCLQLMTFGSFEPDEDGALISSEGLMLMGWLANPDGTIPTHQRDTFDGLEPVKTMGNSGVSNRHVMSIESNGFVRASPGNGRVLYQVPLVDVSHVNGLKALDQHRYRLSPESGSFFLWDAGDGPTGDIVNGAPDFVAQNTQGALPAEFIEHSP